MNERRKFEGEKIALVAHGGVLECAYREAMNLPLNAERTITAYSGERDRSFWSIVTAAHAMLLRG